MKLGFSTNAYRNFSIDESIRSIASIGYSGIEIMCDTPHAFPPLKQDTIDLIKNSLKTSNLEISNLNGFMMCAVQDFHHPSWIEHDENFRNLRIEHTKNCLNLAKELGAYSVSTEPGGPIENITREKGLSIFEDGLNQVIPIAEENHVTLLIEPEPELLIQNSSEFLDFISRFDSDYLRLNFDIGHFFCVNESPDKLLEELKDYTYHIHLEDISNSKKHEHLIPGNGSIDFEKIFFVLEKIGYTGYVTIELYPYLNNPYLAAKQAFDYVSSYM